MVGKRPACYGARFRRGIRGGAKHRSTSRRRLIANDGTHLNATSAAAHSSTARPASLPTILYRVTGVSPADLIAARLIVEPQAAAIAAKNASPSDLAGHRRCPSSASEAHQTDDFEHWDRQFHQRLFAATRNELLASIHDILKVIRCRNAWIEMKRRTFSENRRRDYCAQPATSSWRLRIAMLTARRRPCSRISKRSNSRYSDVARPRMVETHGGASRLSRPRTPVVYCCYDVENGIGGHAQKSGPAGQHWYAVSRPRF